MHIVVDILFIVTLLSLFLISVLATIKKDKPRFKIGEFISTPGGIGQSHYWFKVIRVDASKKEYLLETYDRFRFIMTFEQAKDQCLIVESPWVNEGDLIDRGL